eukprot:5293327-Pleurochrysis_carterae.AAC.1
MAMCHEKYVNQRWPVEAAYWAVLRANVELVQNFFDLSRECQANVKREIEVPRTPFCGSGGKSPASSDAAAWYKPIIGGIVGRFHTEKSCLAKAAEVVRYVSPR